MKKLSFSMLAMAGLLLVGCADKDVIAEGGGGQQGEVISDGYMALNITLPTTSSTRAENDNFDDGLESEYIINNCALLFFVGTNESTAELVHVSTPTWTKVSDVDNDNITNSYKIVSEISGHKKAGTLYALAALNYKTVMTISDNVVTLKGTNTAEPKTVTKLSDLYTEISNINLADASSTNTGFFMTNAVLSTVPGGTIHNPAEAFGTTPAKVFQLAELDKNKIYDTETEAKNNPAGEILVERAVAKATMRITGAKGVSDDNGNLVVEFGPVVWTIDNVEPTTYIARNPGTNDYIGYSSEAFSTTPNYRFVSHTSTAGNTPLGTEKPYYRTYWCHDPQYNKTATLNAYDENPNNKNATFNPSYYSDCGTDKPLYCYENTFNVEHQKYQNTTRAIIKATAKKLDSETTATFYTVNGDYYKDSEKFEAVKAFVCTYGAVQDAINQHLKKEENVTVTFDYNSLKDYIVVVYDTQIGDDGSVSVKSLDLSTDAQDLLSNESTFATSAYADVKAILTKVGTPTSPNELLNSVNAQLEILQYTNGVMYYEARFMHFAGSTNGSSNYVDLAPWNNWESKIDGHAVPTTEESYPDPNKEQNYLGRYGMVRNNWYDVEVTAFNKIGTPTIPDVTSDGTQDDNLSDYISCRIHVLAWARRTQGWQFK